LLDCKVQLELEHLVFEVLFYSYLLLDLFNLFFTFANILNSK
jgi:hypothetical protein